MSDKIRILVIGDERWVDKLTPLLSKDLYSIEIITELDKANERLTHNSYDILILHDKFSKKDSIKLASMAYAMTRPSLIISTSIGVYLYHLAWLHWSKFTNIFKTSKKLINFHYKFKNIDNKIKYLAENYSQYFDIIREEIKQNTL